ncbi:MAG: primosomal protein N' [Flavobacteriia bacterium]|nr:primosomal protein N' [Flavobacteriia bacterium]NBV67950.1 primosomal protein N' [Flavobacteriia bacterium]
MSERITLFADVILPVPIRQEFTYRVPFELNETIAIGQRVIVPFGKNKRITGVVSKIHPNAPVEYQAKYIEFILDEIPLILENQLAFWKWISSYYLAPIGDVLNAALPANFKLASETKVVIHPDFNHNLTDFNEKEVLILQALSHRESSNLKELSEILEVKNIHLYIKRLIDKNAVITQEEINQRYTPKTKTFVKLNSELESTRVAEVLDELQTKKSTQGQFKALLQIIQWSNESNDHQGYIDKTRLIQSEISNASILSLEKKGILRIEKLQVDRLSLSKEATMGAPILNEAQKTALSEIEESWESKDITLLHGVTGSGKTELYIQLIQSYLDLGKQILFLIPEIALTTQLILRLSKYFGNQVGVYHSKFNQNERVEIWSKVFENNLQEYRIILGARSSIFLPYRDLGLVIIDEEHESSYKQHEPSPRYNARDASIYLARMHGAKVLLGSATPSLESYYNAQSNKYGYVLLDKRYKDLSMPEVLIANIRKETKQKSMSSHFSSLLMEHIKTALDQDEQVILFQNRRGFTPLWSCEICSWVPKCDQCDVSLTYHKHSNQLKCHYCGFATQPMGSCKACGSNKLKMLGFGTEKIEDEIQLFFPEAKVARMDLDTTRSKNAYSELIEKFENRGIDILIGTQMLSKGLDFDHVSLVGILDADMLLNRPDFRAFERAFQLMTQVAGRAGRKNKRGKAIIQTAHPDHWVIQLAAAHDTLTFLKGEIIERENFKYPPFYKLIFITLKHQDENMVNWAANAFATDLKLAFKERVLGPEFPVVKRVQNLYQKEIKIKYEKSLSDKKIKEHLMMLLDKFYENVAFKPVKVSIDVDPY